MYWVCSVHHWFSVGWLRQPSRTFVASSAVITTSALEARMVFATRGARASHWLPVEKLAEAPTVWVFNSPTAILLVASLGGSARANAHVLDVDWVSLYLSA